MNFYEHQDRARRRTKIIVFLFIIAVLLIMAIVIIPIGLVSEWNETAVAIAAIFCVLIVGISALVKLAQLNGGGLVVAEMLGGSALQP
ncbi:peptidase M48, partial [PVC group bacterium]|nr:peptidase M48 [PVC group bacterium]